MVVVVIDFAFVTMLPNVSRSACKWTCTRTNSLCVPKNRHNAYVHTCTTTEVNGGKVTHTGAYPTIEHNSLYGF